MDLEAIAKIAVDEMANKRSYPFKSLGDKYYHGQRTAKLALRLRQILFPELTDKDDILTVAAWFHDIYNGHAEYHKIHGEKGAELIRELLVRRCAAMELNEICGIIAIHDERPIETDSITLKLHQDADHLDHFGTNAVRRAVIDAARRDEPMSEALKALKRYENNRILWRSELHFELSRRIFDEKMAFSLTFAERFEIEMNGVIWNEAQILTEWDGAI